MLWAGSGWTVPVSGSRKAIMWCTGASDRRDVPVEAADLSQTFLKRDRAGLSATSFFFAKKIWGGKTFSKIIPYLYHLSG